MKNRSKTPSTRKRKIMRGLKIILGVMIGLGFFGVPAVLQQTSKDMKALRDAMRELKTSQQAMQAELKAGQQAMQAELKANQQAVQKQLQELRALVPRGRQAPQPSREVELRIENAPFQGEQQARLTLVEFSDYQ